MLEDEKKCFTCPPHNDHLDPTVLLVPLFHSFCHLSDHCQTQAVQLLWPGNEDEKGCIYGKIWSECLLRRIHPTPSRTSVLSSSSSSVILTNNQSNSEKLQNKDFCLLFNLFLKYNCFITLRRIIVEKIDWLDIKETLVLHLLNLAIGGADYLPFASLLVIVKSACLGDYYYYY